MMIDLPAPDVFALSKPRASSCLCQVYLMIVGLEFGVQVSGVQC